MSQTKLNSPTDGSLPRRALSPHMQIWRWHITMLASIVNRATGIGSLGGMVLIVAWLLCLALGSDAYTTFTAIAASKLGLVVWFLASLAGFVHLFGGIRHLIWDTGAGFSLKSANSLAIWTLILPVISTLAFWAYLIVSQKVVL
jgi:succinate dehydrogenase / fumarate reductase cytochrome b subunit